MELEYSARLEIRLGELEVYIRTERTDINDKRSEFARVHSEPAHVVNV